MRRIRFPALKRHTDRLPKAFRRFFRRTRIEPSAPKPRDLETVLREALCSARERERTLESDQVGGQQ